MKVGRRIGAKKIVVTVLVSILLVGVCITAGIANTGLQESHIYSSKPDTSDDSLIENSVNVSTADASMGRIYFAEKDTVMNEGDVWHFTATPNDGYIFTGWEFPGDSLLSEADCDGASLTISFEKFNGATTHAVASFAAASPTETNAPETTADNIVPQPAPTPDNGEPQATPTPDNSEPQAELSADELLATLAKQFSTIEDLMAAYPTIEDLHAAYPVLTDVITSYPVLENSTEATDETINAPTDPDGLGGPVKPGTGKKTPKVFDKSASSFSPMMASSSSSLEWPNAGAVYVTKDAIDTATDGRYRIDLEVMGKNTETSSDIVVVLDDSGSMLGNIDEMKTAANSLVDELITNDSNIRIAIVTINANGAGLAGVIHDFSNDADSLKTAIGSIHASGGTNLQGGLYEARKLINDSNADSKNVIFMSDGFPTYSFKANCTPDPTPVHNHGASGYLQWTPNPNSFSLDNLIINSFDYNNVVGSGDSYEFYHNEYFYFERFSCSDGHATVTADYKVRGDNGIGTKFEAQLLKNAGATVYSIGFNLSGNDTAQEVMSACSSGGSYYGASLGDLQSVFSKVGSNILYAAEDVVITDPMSDYFDLEITGSTTWALAGTPEADTADVVVTAGQVQFLQDANSKYTLVWTLDAITEQYEADGVTPKGEVISYFINIASGVNAAQLYPANKDTSVEYTDVNGNANQSKIGYEDGSSGDFTIPLVSGGKGSIEVVYCSVNANGDWTNSSGEVVPTPIMAQTLDTFSHEESGNPALEVPGTYTVAPDSIITFNDESYVLHNDFSEISVGLSSTESMKTVYFGYMETNTITWNNWDNSLLEKDIGVLDGVLPQYNGSTPTRASTDEYNYTFAGWTPEIAEVSGSATYTATYTPQRRSYTITFNIGTNGTTNDTKLFDVPYGDPFPTIPSITAADGYTFNGWSPDLNSPPSIVTESKTYTAQYKKKIYDITFNIGDHGTWGGSDVADKIVPTEHDATPLAPTPVENTGWNFTGWNPSIEPATGAVTYTAQYEKETYAITFKIGDHGTWDGSDVADKVVPTDYNEMPLAPTPAENTGWSFTGWSPTIVKATGEATYTAQYKKKIYDITFEIGDHGTWDGTDVADKVVPTEHDEMPLAPTPVENTGWDFTGWSPSIEPATGAVTYTAQYKKKIYDITFNIGDHGTWDGTDIADKIVPTEHNATPLAPTPVENTGWDFTGWNPSIEPATGAVTYTAQYEKETYDITFEIGDHGTWDGTDVADKVVPTDYNEMPLAPTPVEDTGWSFTGWNPSIEPATGEATYTAQYEKEIYDITFEIGDHGTWDGTDVTDKVVPTEHDATPLAPTPIANAGWTFDRWDPTIEPATGETTYTAQYTQIDYDIEFIVGVNGTTSDTVLFEDVHYGDVFPTIPSVDGTNGYSFTGWDPDLSTPPGTVTGSAIYTAQYTQDKYTVTFAAGTNGSLTGTLVHSDITYDSEFPNAPEVSADDGYTFSGWSPVLPTKVTGTETYTAQYTQDEYTITFEAGTNGTLSGTSVFSGLHYDDVFPNAPTVTPDSTHVFSGWSPSLPNKVTGSQVYTAQYALIEYTVTFVDHDGTLLGTTSVLPGQTATAPVQPTREGHTFTGWSPALTNIQGDTIVTAQYDINTFTVRFFESDGSTQIGTTQTIDWNTAATFETAPTVTGSAFDEWVLTGDDSTVTTRLTSVRENIDAVASYIVNGYTVTFIDYDDSVIGTDGVLHGGSAQAPSLPDHYGYEFTGWDGAFDNVTSDLTIKALYDVLPLYDVTVTVIGEGSVSDIGGPYIQGAEINLSSIGYIPADGYSFSQWQDVDGNPITSLTIEGDTEIFIVFTQIIEQEDVPETIDDEPVSVASTEDNDSDDGSAWWWLLLIPGGLLLWWLFALWFAIIPIAEDVTVNPDMTFTIQWGYKNRKVVKSKVKEKKSFLSIIAGELISSSDRPPYEFEKGRVENVFTTVVSKDAKIEWKIKNRKAKVDLSK